MDRKLLVELFQDGMKYPPGKHRVAISRVFEITVRPDQVVELDEYEGVSTHNGLATRSRRPIEPDSSGDLFHIGRSILHLKDGSVVEEPGAGWGRSKMSK